MQPTEAAPEPVIDVAELEVVRGGRRVLPGISLTIRRGVITGLLGPSGSGKSTLMRAIVGVQKVAGGEVTVLDHPAGTAELRRRVAYVTQAPSVYADLTVRENLEYFTRILPVLRSELWATFHALAQEGRTLIVSTHVMDEAERCDELVLMREGRVVASGTPAALREETRTDTVEQAFIALAEQG